MVVQIQQFAQFAGEAFGVFQILYFEGAAGNFVFVSGAYATACGADFLLASAFQRDFTRLVQRGVQGQNQGAGFADAQAAFDFYASFFQPCDFFQQFGDRQHYAIADIAFHAWAHDAAGDEVQRGFLAVDDEGVACVVAALEAHHALRQFGQPIDQFALAFVAPLRADDNNIFSARSGAHNSSQFKKTKRIKGG